MATLWQRLTGQIPEKRAAQPTIPTREAATVTADTAITLTAVYRAVQIIATPIRGSRSACAVCKTHGRAWDQPE